MSEWALVDTGEVCDEGGADTSDSGGTNVDSDNTTSNTLGAWQQVYAATQVEASWIVVSLGPNPNEAGLMVSIGIGSAGNEMTILDRLNAPNFPEPDITVWSFPVYIPKGERIAAQSQTWSGTLPDPCDVSVHLIGGGPLAPAPYSQVDVYANTGGTDGVSVDPGAVANTKPATFTEITASCQTIKQLWVFTAQANATMGINEKWLLDIALGSSGAEYVIIPNLRVTVDSGKDTMLPKIQGPFNIHIPSGERISARCQSTETSSADRPLLVGMYGVR